MADVIDRENATALNGVDYTTSIQDGGILISKKQDVSEILKRAKFERDAFPEHNGFIGKDMSKVATIPNIVVEQLMKDGIWQDKKRLKAWLNDPDNKAFRTNKGRV